MDLPETEKFIVLGIMPNGRKFRPSDWAERMCGTLSTFRNRRIYYSPLLRPAVIEGIKAVVVDRNLEEKHPKVFAEVLAFAEKNQLALSPLNT